MVKRGNQKLNNKMNDQLTVQNKVLKLNRRKMIFKSTFTQAKHQIIQLLGDDEPTSKNELR